MDISQLFVIVQADDISCDTDAISNTVQISDSVIKPDKILPAEASPQVQPSHQSTTLPPPNRFRRQDCSGAKKGFRADVKLNTQNLTYLASYRAATGQLLNETEIRTKPSCEDERSRLRRFSDNDAHTLDI